MSFRKGDKVICIDANYSYGRTEAVDETAMSMIKNFPKLLHVYTVRVTEPKRTMILLAEIINPILVNNEGRSMEEIHWNEWRFIKVKKETLKQPRKMATENAIQLDLFHEVKVIEESEILETT